MTVPELGATTPRRPDRRGVARIRPGITAALAATVALALAVIGERWYADVRHHVARARLEREALALATTLESVIAHRMAVLHGMASFISVHWGLPELETEFDAFAAGVLRGTPGLRTVQYVVDGVIRRTWPLEGNEGALGRDLSTDRRPQLVADYQRAMTSHEISLSGPTELYQGGFGLIGRLSVRDAADSVVALAAVVIDFGTVITESGLDRPAGPLLLRLRDASDSVVWVQDGRELADPVMLPVELPDRQWQLEATPAAGWAAELGGDQRSYWLAVGPVILLLAGLAWALQAWQRTRIEASHVADLRRAEETFRQLFQLVPDGVVVSRVSDAIILEVNDAYTAMVQRTREELIGRALQETGVWVSLEARQQALELLQQVGTVSEFPFQLRRADGSTWDVVLSARRMQLHGESCHLAVVRDVHERVRLEQRLAQSQRLEAVGRLAGGIAHDFNNLITGIRGYADLLHDGMAAEDPRRSDLAEIQRAGTRAADLTRQLLTFARRQVIAPRVVDLNRLLRDAEPMLQRLTRAGTTLTLHYSPESVAVLIDPAQFDQVLTNLAVNARDAMPDGGRLDVSVAGDATHAVLSVRDTGVGIPAEALPHLYEPFYTTKSDGRGTGLGLATVYGIVEQAEGRIEVQSEVGRGTEFRVFLPRVATTAVHGGTAYEPAPLPRGSETILVVDDEPQIRDICGRLLGRLGYTVLAERDGRAALDRLAEGHRVALVLSDMVMPGMGGWELATTLLERQDGPKVILMSGYSAELVATIRDEVPFLAKPFTARELAELVRATLDGCPTT